MHKLRLPTFFYPLGVVALGVLLFYPFEGGLFFTLIAKPYIILPLIILTFILVIGLTNSLLNAAFGKKKLPLIKKYSGLATLLLFGLNWGLHTELFKSEIILRASLNDDLFHENLILRKNGKCEVETAGWLGYNNVVKSKYILRGDTLFLQFEETNKPPFGNILLIDTAQNAIFFNREDDGHFDKKMEWLNNLEIYTHDLEKMNEESH